MSLSVQAIGQAPQASPLGPVQPTKSGGADQDGGAAKTGAQFGGGPAATISISAQAKAAQAAAQAKVAQQRALALAIKNGHDPDGVQDGK